MNNALAHLGEKSAAVKVAVATAIDSTMAILVFAQIKAAQDAGFEVHGICSQGPNYDFLKNNGVHMHIVRIRRSISPLSDLAAVFNMWRYFKRQKFTIVHTHTPKQTLLGQLAAKLAGVPIIINTVHGLCFHEQMKPLKKYFLMAVEWIAGKFSTIILSQNPEDVDTAIRLGIAKPDRIKILGNGIDLTKFEPSRFDEDFKKNKRRQIGVPADAAVIGIIGRLTKEKGYLELFEAMKTVMVNNSQVWLVIIGPEEPEKSDRIAGDTYKLYGIGDRTVWLGWRTDTPELLSCLDIYTLPSWREGFPRSAIEAVAMGLPIVATNIRGCRQVVEEGVNGFLVPLHDIDALANALIKLAQNKHLREEMGLAGRRKALKEFDENKVCKTVINTYNELLSERSRKHLGRRFSKVD